VAHTRTIWSDCRARGWPLSVPSTVDVERDLSRTRSISTLALTNVGGWCVCARACVCVRVCTSAKEAVLQVVERVHVAPQLVAHLGEEAEVRTA
jgi:hypothetical protein